MATAPPRPVNGPAAASNEETSRQRGQRIQHDYLKRRSWMDRWYTGLWITALVSGLVWLGVTFAIPGAVDAQSTHGPVADVHAMWDNKCEACHKPYTAINNNRWSPSWLPWSTSAVPVSDSNNCASCHAGPAHHASVKDESVMSCGSCHRDHRGRDADIRSGLDTDCTRCHGNLPAHTKTEIDGKPYQPVYQQDGKGGYEPITSFASNHTAFKLHRQAKDRKLKFSHKLHMTPGILGEPKPDSDPATTTAWTLAKIKAVNPAMAERYRLEQPEGAGHEDSSAVQLSCMSCHRNDAGLGDPWSKAADRGLGDIPRAAALPARASGAYMQPIVFDNHCAACHPLMVQGGSGGLAGTVAPHRLDYAELQKFLQGAYAAEAVKDPSFQLFLPPGRTLGRLDKPEEKLTEQQRITKGSVDAKVKKSMQLFEEGTCIKCHDIDKKGDNWAVRVPEANDPLGPRIVPTVWQPHARFDHVSHQAVNCGHCHKELWPNPGEKVASQKTIAEDEKADPTPHMPDVNNCKQCHAPAQVVDGKSIGGAQWNCSECHSFHNGDKPFQGYGSTHWVPSGKKEQTTEDALRKFLEGRPNR